MSPLSDRRYWSSLAGTGSGTDAPDGGDGASRREFLRLMGASLGLAGMVACRWPEERIAPFAYRPEGVVPGAAQHFATAFELGGTALGMVVTSWDGRPIKAEGSPDHPDSRGALSALAQASVLELYDPDRSRQPIRRGGGESLAQTWELFVSFAHEHFAALRSSAGSGLAVLAEPSSSPSLEALRLRFLEAFRGARWYEWGPLSRDNEREGMRLAYGRPLRLDPRLDRARVIACFDADPLLGHPAAVRLAGLFADGRKPDSGTMSRLYVAEPSFTTSGAMADHRLPVVFSQVPALLVAVARLLVTEHGVRLPEEAAAQLSAVDAPSFADEQFASTLARDLARHGGQGVLLVGARQEPAVHALARALDHALGNVGTTVRLLEEPAPERASHLDSLRELGARMRAGEVSTLLVLGGNPAFDTPADLGFGELLGKVKTSIHLALHDDETSRACTLHVPRAHLLEAWGDARAWDGTVTLSQPLIEPLYGGRSDLELLALCLGDAEPIKGHDIVRATAQRRAPSGDFERWWRQCLHQGFEPGTSWPELGAPPSLDTAGLASAVRRLTEQLAPREPGDDRLELDFVGDARVHDGRFANNGWLQELPDAITRLTWGNALLIAPSTAHRLGLDDGDVVAVQTDAATIEAPICQLPGQASGSVTLALGYGRSAAGRVGNGVGVNAYRLRRSDALHVTLARLTPTGRRQPLATVQDHHAIDRLGFETRNQRAQVLVREAELQEYLRDPNVIRERSEQPELFSLWKERPWEGEQWGMVVDLNACVGCNACVVACQAENNVPIVGREQVLRQREMHWLRLDRYFVSEPGLRPEEVSRPEAVFQPLACVHCEMAPCEEVCPVAATQHTPDGLNAMAYNRCVGTRYCSNNCPYKVRRFNFFNFNRDLDDLTGMQRNPDVTVRSRGVMEKCTYCVQRIARARIAARNERRAIRDGEVVPACAQTCPARAITFGNVNDPSSAVSRLREERRSYALLGELNVRPRTLYLARLRNRAGDDAHGGNR